MFAMVTIAAASCCGPRQSAKEGDPDNLLLKDFSPVSIYNIGETLVEKARFGVIDAHTHDYAADRNEVEAWVGAMDASGVEVSHVMSCNWLGQPLDSMLHKYAEWPDRFRFWCSFDYTGFDLPDWEERALASLQRYFEMGIVGVGEMGDKGLGDMYGHPVPGRDIHIDNPRLRPLLAKCAELDMPVSIHIAEPIWMYEPMEDYDELIGTFERAVAQNPATTFIACHYLNMNHDLPRLAAMLDRYSNMYIDLAARIPESAAIPRATREFIIKYADRILFGTDVGMNASMYRNQYRILETADEHIYFHDYDNYGYHWPLAGFHLPDDVLEKIYNANAKRLFRR